MISCAVDPETRTLSVKIGKSTVQIQLYSHEAQVSWYWVIKQAIFLFNAEGVAFQRKTFLLLNERIAGLYSRSLGLKTVSSHGCVFDQVAHFADKSRLVFHLLLSGPLSLLHDDTLLHIGDLSNASPRALASLRAVSKRFKRLFSRDEFWQHHELPSCTYQGRESDYNESTDELVQDMSGLPRFNALRVKWCALHSSRLRLYIGYLPEKNSFVELGKQLMRTLLSAPPVVEKCNVLVLGADAPISLAVHSAILHLLPPSSRVASHDACLLPEDTLLAMDSVQPLSGGSDSSSRRQSPLLVRVERAGLRGLGERGSIASTLRVIGDARLKFVRLLPWDDAHSERQRLLRESGVASILVLPLDSFEITSTELRACLQSLYRQVHSSVLLTTSISASLSLPAVESPAESNPCLIFLPVPAHATADHIARTTQRIHNECVLPVVRRERQYILQPFDPLLVSASDIQRGYLRGVNWLVRALSKRTVIFGK